MTNALNSQFSESQSFLFLPHFDSSDIKISKNTFFHVLKKKKIPIVNKPGKVVLHFLNIVFQDHFKTNTLNFQFSERQFSLFLPHFDSTDIKI